MTTSDPMFEDLARYLVFAAVGIGLVLLLVWLIPRILGVTVLP